MITQTQTNANAIGELTKWLTDEYAWRWTVAPSARSSADKMLCMMAELGIIKMYNHRFGGYVWVANGKAYGRLDGIRYDAEKGKLFYEEKELRPVHNIHAAALDEEVMCDLQTVLDAAKQHADNNQAWNNVPGQAYFESNLRRAANRTKLHEAINRVRKLIMK